jgi:mono/diheme cytochrome c family protein
LQPLTEINPRSSVAFSSKPLVAALLLVLFGSTGCWEQASSEWWPQMKWQIAVQAFEDNPYQDRVSLFVPPEGSVPVGWGDVVKPALLSLPEQEALANPQKATLQSLKNGERLFNVNCAVCHGPTGAGDGPIAAPNGPITGVLPIGPGSPLGFNLAAALSDGHIYTTISLGRGRMPNYRRISPEGRWDVVNYLRDLDGQGGR